MGTARSWRFFGTNTCAAFMIYAGCQTSPAAPSKHATDPPKTTPQSDLAPSPVFDRTLRVQPLDRLDDTQAGELVRQFEQRFAAAGIAATVVRAGASFVVRVPASLPQSQAQMLASSGQLVVGEVDAGTWLETLDLGKYPGATRATQAHEQGQFRYLSIEHSPIGHPVEALAPAGLHMLRAQDELGWRLLFVHAGELRADCLSAVAAQEDGFWHVKVRLRERDAEQLMAVTTQALGKHVAIALDHEVISLPVVQSAIGHGALLLNADDEAGARMMAAVLSHPLRVQLMP
jgi:preprotein translocase subunit SecD